MQREQTLNLCIYGFCYWICCFAVIALLCYSSTGGVTYCIVFPIVWFYCEVHLNFVKMKWSACQECGTKKKIKVPDRICFFSFFHFFLCLMLKTCWSFHFHICFTKLTNLASFIWTSNLHYTNSFFLSLGLLLS